MLYKKPFSTRKQTEDRSDVYGTLIAEHEKIPITFRGLRPIVNRLFFLIREPKPPRDINVQIHSLWSLEQYKALFHDEVNAGHFSIGT